MSFSPAGGANSAPPNPLGGFKGPLRGGKEKKKGRKGEEKESDGRETPSPPPKKK